MKNDKIEIKEKDLEDVTGGDVTSANIVGKVNPHCRPWPENISAAMPPINDDEKYIKSVDPTDAQIIGGPTTA